MDVHKVFVELYRQLDSEDPPSTVMKRAAGILQKSFKKTVIDIGVLTESTARLRFVNDDRRLEEFRSRAIDIFEHGKRTVLKKELPSGFKYLLIAPAVFKGHKLGILLCLGKDTRQIKEFEQFTEDLGFIYTESQLKFRLIKDSVLMNTIISAGRYTAQATETGKLIGNLLPQIKNYLRACAVKVFLWDGAEVTVYDADGTGTGVKLPSGKSIIKKVKVSGRALMVKGVRDNSDYNAEVDSLGCEAENILAAPVKSENEVRGVLAAVNDDPERVFLGSELVWVRSVCGEIGAFLEKVKLYGELKKLFHSSVETLVSAMEGKDPYTHGHSRRVTMFAMVIGKELGLDEDQLENIRLSSLLHDIGKIAVPESVLLKPGKLTEDEWYVLKQHPEKGVQMLENVSEFSGLIPGILHHHEHFDGSGYPQGLKGTDIPMVARIITVADAFDAMTSQRVYRKARTEKEALEEISRCRGTHFDPEIADVFVRIYTERFFAGEDS